MLILYDTDSSGSLCYEEFKIMIENLESLDPASVGRFWIRQFGWFLLQIFRAETRAQ